MYNTAELRECAGCGRKYRHKCSPCFINSTIKELQSINKYYTQWRRRGTWGVMKRELSGDCLVHRGSLADCKQWIKDHEEE